MAIHNPTFLFIKLPKTGGTSIEAFLNRNFYCEDIQDAGFNGKVNPLTSVITHWGDHLLNSITNPIDKKRIHKGLRFTVVRSPYSKCLSAYNYIRNHFKNPFLQDNDIETCLKQPHNFWNNHDYIHFYLSQSQLLYEERIQRNLTKGKLVDDTQYTNTPPELTILKYENLDESFKNFIEPLNSSLTNINLPKLRRSNYTHHTLNRKCIDIINNIYHEDFINFGYKKL